MREEGHITPIPQSYNSKCVNGISIIRDIVLCVIRHNAESIVESY